MQRAIEAKDVEGFNKYILHLTKASAHFERKDPEGPKGPSNWPEHLLSVYGEEMANIIQAYIDYSESVSRAQSRLKNK